jgi:membrane-associated phospholipid phosphatase
MILLKKLFNKQAYLSLIVTSLFFSGYAQNWDINLLKNINPQNPNSSVWKTATSSAYPVSIGIPVGMWVVSKINHDKKTELKSYEIAGSVIVAAVVTEGLKVVINRERPYIKYPLDIHPYNNTEVGNSFPSAHTSLAFATATSLSIECKKWYVVVPAYAWAAGVGYSRLYQGEHYPSDVLAGAVVGAGSAWLSHWLNKKFIHINNK